MRSIALKTIIFYLSSYLYLLAITIAAYYLFYYNNALAPIILSIKKSLIIFI